MDVSFIIPALNEEKYISRTLRSIQKQETGLNFEIIVVDGGSTDKTVEIAEKYADKVLHQKGGGIAAARNLGAKKAKGKILVFLDADTRIPKNYLSKVWEKMNQGIICLGARIKFTSKRNAPTHTKKLVAAVSKIADTYFSIKSRLKRPIFMGINIVVWKDVFEKMGGFPEVPSEDVAFSSKLPKFGRAEYYTGTQVISSARRFEGAKDVIETFLYYKMRDIISLLELSEHERLKTLGEKLEKVKFAKYKEAK